MVTTQRVKDLVLESLAALNEDKSGDEKIPVSGDVVLMGADALLDSLDMINLIINLEERLYAATDQQIQLAADAQSFEDDHPFRTVSTLIDHIAGLLKSGSDSD